MAARRERRSAGNQPPGARGPRGEVEIEPLDLDPDRSTRADPASVESFEYVTGEVPYLTQEERLLAEERVEAPSGDARDREAPEEPLADSVAFDERDDVNTSDDVDRQGRRGQEEHDWAGDMYADSGRGRPSEPGSRRRRG